jgi:hypothetical protein
MVKGYLGYDGITTEAVRLSVRIHKCGGRQIAISSIRVECFRRQKCRFYLSSLICNYPSLFGLTLEECPFLE